MRKFSLSLAVLFVAGLLVATPPVFAGTDKSSSSMTSDTHTNMAMDSFRANDLIGKTVRNNQNEDLGKVHDIVIGRDGQVNFVVLSRGGALGVGEKYVPIPYKTFMTSANNIARVDNDKDVIANLDKAKLDAAPQFDDKNWDRGSRDWESRVDSYYGASPTR